MNPFFTLTATLLFSLASLCAETIKVACVGDSITWGARIKERETNCYPAQLQKLLGKPYEVRNFGVSGSTLLTKGNKPYIRQNFYKQALACKPDIVIIKLGTNDCKGINWKRSEAFVEDYKNLVESFKNLESKPSIWLCLPVHSFRDLSKYPPNQVAKHISQANIEEAIPKIKTVATDMSLEIIDLHSLLTKKKFYNPDEIHPNKEGATLIAKKIAEAIQASQKSASK